MLTSLLSSNPNTTAIGYYSTTVTAHNSIHLGNSSVSEIAGNVAFSTYSDKRFKKNIAPEVHGLDFIMKLEPVTYHWNAVKLDKFLGVDEEVSNNPEALKSRAEAEKITYTGFLARDVEKVTEEVGYDFSGVVHPQNEQSVYSVRYAKFVVPLVKGMQEQQSEIEKLKTENNALKKRLERLKKMIER